MSKARLDLRALSLDLWRACLGALAIAASSGLGAAPLPVPVIRPEGAPLEVSKAFAFDEKTRRSASGIACAAGAMPRMCLVVFDEGVKAQFATLGAHSLAAAGDPIALVGSGGELDAEGASTDGEYFYAIGSHSVKRKDCASNPASRYVVRFKARWTAAASGAPTLAIDALQPTGRLWELMTRDPYLGRHVDGCLGAGQGGRLQQMARRPGLNIEGIAVMGGRLYVGFRGPSEAGVVPVYSVEAAALFDGTDPKPKLAKLRVGSRQGIRDMVAADGAMLLLIGPDDHDPAGAPKWHVAEWRGGGASASTVQPRVLATLDLRDLSFGGCFKELKPEALAIVELSASGYKIVVLSDGVCDGGPLIFNVPR